MSVRAPRIAFLPSILLVLACGCDSSTTGVNHEVYRALPGEELNLRSAGCILRESGSGAGGSVAEAGEAQPGQFAMEQRATNDGGVEITYWVAKAPLGPEQPLEPNTPEAVIAAVVEIDAEQLASGDQIQVEFDDPEGTHFEAIHWGSPDGC
uniref:Lipoprotein n=1 Tax=Pseudenhygromyxa salsuginis TaxID=442868 RepID=A0A3Q8I1X3_9BACT|nr:hypothetical protein [Pseudenhygromyxa salsuginis]